MLNLDTKKVFKKVKCCIGGWGRDKKQMINYTEQFKKSQKGIKYLDFANLFNCFKLYRLLSKQKK